VADGGSSDGTRCVARDHPLRPAVIEAPRGRARLMNAGAAIARGELLLSCTPAPGCPPGPGRRSRRSRAAPGSSGATTRWPGCCDAWVRRGARRARR